MPFSRLPLIRLTQVRQRETKNACGHIGETHRSRSADSGPDQFTVALGITDTQTEAVTHAGKHSQSIGQEEASATTSALTAP